MWQIEAKYYSASRQTLQAAGLVFQWLILQTHASNTATPLFPLDLGYSISKT